MKRGVSQGSHWAWEGTTSPEQGDATNIITSLEDTYVSDAESPPCPSCSLGGLDVSSCGRRSGHSPASSCPLFTVSAGLVVTTKTTTLITVLLAASASTAAIVYREVVDGKKAKSLHIRWRSRTAKGMCSADPECTQHSSFPNQGCQFRLIRRPSPHESDGCPPSTVEWVSAPLLVSLFPA